MSSTEEKTFRIKEGSALPIMSCTLIDGENGLAVSLANVDEIRVKISDDEMQLIDQSVTFSTDESGSEKGKVYVDPTLFSARHGRYYAEFDVYWTANRVPQTFPEEDYVSIIVVENLD